MPLFYQQNINENTRLAVWQIEESESFFNLQLPLLSQITHPNKRLQHLAGRYLLPFLFPAFPSTQIEIADTRKPFLRSEQFHFSISHCGKYASAIVSNWQRVGIDVEMITPRLHRIKQKFLHRDELRFVNAQLPHLQLQYLSILWSAKEAMYKWYGLGEVDFSEMMRTFPFQLQLEGEIAGAFIKEDFQQKLAIHYKLIDELTVVWVVS